MDSICLEVFWDQFNALPESVRIEAKKSFLLWKANPEHPSVNFKKVKGKSGLWSARINQSYRALCVRDKNKYVWFFIGNHSDYDSILYNAK